MVSVCRRLGHESTFPLKMPRSVKEAAARLARAEGVSLNQFIAVAVAEKVGTLETAGELRRRAANATPGDLLRFLQGAPAAAPPPEDAR
jgi:hypothetical protein